MEKKSWLWKRKSSDRSLGETTESSGSTSSHSERYSDEQNVKKDIPGISFLEIGKVLGDRWKNLTPEQREPYEPRAEADKKRYRDEISGYKNSQQPTNIDYG